MAGNTTETRRKDKRTAEPDPQRREPSRLAGETQPLRARPANENDPGTSMMLAKLRRQPSFTPYYVAFALSLVWIAGWSFIFSNTLLGGASPNGGSAMPETMRAVALLLLPIGVIWVTAYFLWRASQLRQVSEVLMQSAMRLIRPQDIAAEGLTTIAQAVRNEIDLLVGGVEHAMQRATVLEEIVHKEIAAIERAFGGNEDRIRNLVSGIENQRNALHQAGLIINNDANPMLARLETNTQTLDAVVGTAQATLAKIESGLRDTTVNLSRTIDEVANRAAAASSDIGGQTSQMERMTGMMVGELRNFSSQLQSQIESLSKATSVLSNESAAFGHSVQNAEGNISHVIRQSIEHLSAINQDIVRTVERASVTASDQMRQTTTELSETIQTAGGNLTYHLKSTANDVMSVIERSSADSAQQIEHSRGLVTQGLQTLSTDFLDRVAQARTDLVTYLDGSSVDMANTLHTAAANIVGNLSTTSSQLISGMDQTANNLLGRLNSSASGLAGHIEQSATRLYDEIDQRATGILTRFNDQASVVGTRVEDITGRILSTLVERTDSITERVDSSTSSFLSSVETQSRQAVSRLDDYAKLLSETYQRGTANFQAVIGGSAEDLEARIDGAAERLYGHMNATVTSVAGKIDEATTDVYDRLNQSAGSIASQLQTSGTYVNELLVSTSGTISSHIKETGEIVTQQMQESGIALAQKIEGSGGLVTEKLITVSGDFVNKIGTARDELFSLLDRSSNDMTVRLQDTAQNLYSRLDHASGQINTELESTAERITGLISTTATDVTSKVAKVTEKLSVQLDDQSQQLGSLLESTSERLGGQLEQASNDLSMLFASGSEDLTGRLDKTSSEISALFTANTKMMTEQLDQTSSEVTTAFAETALNVTRQVSDANSSIVRRLEDTAGEVTAQLDTAGSSMFTKIDTTARDLGQRFDMATSLLERMTSDISGKLEGTGARFAEVLDEASTQILSDLGRARDVFAESLGNTTLQISGRLEQDTGLMIGRVDTAARELDAAATSTSARLDDAHRKFAKHVEGANAYLAEQFATTAGAIDERLEVISTQMSSKLENTSNRIIDNLGQVSTLVERSVDKFNNEMERVLVHRKEALDDLVADASKRAAEIDAVMNSYLSLIENSLAASEVRAKEISRIVAEQSGQAVQNLEQEIRRLEANSGGQITQASKVLREQHERAMAAMNEMLSSTASDFQQTAQDMRLTAQQVVKDIDAARSELKRAILELPDETRSNADAMRRVVSDQIAALNALADVVKRQAGVLDISGPGLSMRRSGDPAPGKSEGATAEAPLSWPVSAPRKAPERIEAVNDMPLPAAEPQPAPEAARQPDLPKAMDSLVDKLNESARDLVEAIDGTLPRDLEKTYARGERDVYSHRLFESRGNSFQKTLAGRYGSDRLLRARADSYIRLFERLLDTVSEAPKGERLVEACLASESGRIYVMLAEAAGRLPPQ